MDGGGAMTDDTTALKSKRVPGRKPGSAQRDELLRIWGHVDDDGRKLMLFFARTLARDQGLVPSDAPLLMTDRVF
jgi:hypothetical protein